MKNRIVFLVVILSLVLPWKGLAQGTQSGGDLALGIRQVEEGDLDQAVITLDAVIQRLARLKGVEKDLATAHLYLGMAHLGLSQWERAKAEMRDAWRNNPEMRLDPQKFPPRVLQTFEEARKEARAEEAARTPAAAPTPQPTGAANEPSKKTGGGGNKGLLIIGGVAVAGGGIALASGGKATATPAPTPSGSAGSFQVTSAAPASGGRVSLPQLLGSGNAQPFLEIEFTLPANASNALNWTISLQRGATECLATQGVYAQRLDKPSDAPYVAGTVPARFSVAFWVIRPVQGTVPTCGTTFTTDSLVFNFNDSGVALSRTVNIGWTFSQ